jgi:16S rRNA (guanine527-N7)-methyltransferase
MPPEAAPGDWDQARKQLDQGLAGLNLDLPAPSRDQLMALLRLLTQWNRTYNLTALRSPAQQVAGHLLDSLAVLTHLPPGRLIDVGTGAGFPGLPLAIARPDTPHALLDSNLKKTRFVQHAALTLDLRNVEVVRQRAEQYQPQAAFPVVVTRAFAPLPRLLRLIGHLCAPGGRLLALKGPAAASELTELPARFEHIDTLTLPAVAGGGQRTLVVLARRAVG